MSAEPGYEKDNAITRLAARVKQENMERGHMRRSGPVTLGTGPSVRSAAMDPPPLSPEEQARRDAAARDLGLIEKDPDAPADYASFEEAAAAGAPISPLAADNREQRMSREFQSRTPLRGGAFMPPMAPRLPDFRKVESFDFTRNVITLDGLEFPIPEDDVREMKGYAVQIALDHVVRSLAEALTAFGLPPEMAEAAAAKLKEGVSDDMSMRVDGHLGGEPPAQGVPVPSVRQGEEHGVDLAERGEAEGPAGEGS